MWVSRKPDAIHRISKVRSSRFGLPLALALAESLIRLEDVSGNSRSTSLMVSLLCCVLFPNGVESWQSNIPSLTY